MLSRNFKNRIEAGKRLSGQLGKYKNSPNAVVLGLPRGGMVVAAEVAKALNLPLDFVILRKLGAPGNPELAIGAVSEDGIEILDSDLAKTEGANHEYVNKKIEEEKSVIEGRIALYRAKKPKLNLQNKTAIIVDDGIATGMTMKAAIKSARSRGAGKVVMAVPVCPSDILKTFHGQIDEVICSNPSDFLLAIGSFYADFPEVGDDEVLEIINAATLFYK